MNNELVSRIKKYLQSHNSEWVPEKLILTLASKNKYLYEETKVALATISHTPPYAEQWISEYHHSHGLTRGKYYRWYDMQPKELRVIQEGLAYFETLPD